MTAGQQVVQLLNTSLRGYAARLEADVGLQRPRPPLPASPLLALPPSSPPSPRPPLLGWGPEVLAWLAGRVDFAGGAYPLEGAKQVSTVTVRHVSRVVRALTAELQQQRQAGTLYSSSSSSSGSSGGGSGDAAAGIEPLYRLEVAASGQELLARRTGASASGVPG